LRGEAYARLLAGVEEFSGGTASAIASASCARKIAHRRRERFMAKEFLDRVEVDSKHCQARSKM